MGTLWRRWSERARPAGVVGAVLVVGVVAESCSTAFEEPGVWVPDLAVGVFIAVAAAVVLRTEDGGRVGWLIAITAFAWFVGNFVSVETVWVAWLATHLALVHRAIIAHALIVYPSGLVKGPLERATIVIAYLGVLVPVLARDQRWTMLWATGLLLVFLGLLHARTALLRAAGLQALPAMTMLWTTLMAVATMVLVLGDVPVPRIAALTYEFGIVATIALFVAGMADWRRRTAEVADAVVEITYGPASNVRDLLAEALRDPSVEVAFAVPGDETHHWVDELGRDVPPLSGGGRAVVPIRVDGRSRRGAGVGGRLRTLARPACGGRSGDGSGRRERPSASAPSTPGRAAAGVSPSAALGRRRRTTTPRRAARARGRPDDGSNA